ncbi:zinc finger protein [Fusarium sp. NRRL 52700]|nr:zinc finger protein [Fusarium sp. NRRL 52700]
MAEIISLVVNSIELAKLAGEVYKAIKSFDGLPRAFEEVNNQLPLTLDPSAISPAKGVLKQCGENIDGLVKIFQALKAAEGKSIKKVYTRVIMAIGKRGRVEDLMHDTLTSLKRLAENQTFRLSDTIDKLQKACEEVYSVPPSISESEMDRMFSTANLQQIGDHNVQNANQGDAFNNFGGAQNFGAAERTGTWLIESPLYRDWREPNSSTKVFWLHGNAGYGKSVLCVQAIRDFERQFKAWFGRPADTAVHFYDSSDEQELAYTVYRNIANNLLNQRYTIEDDISKELYHFSGMDCNETILREFIITITGELETAYIFIDGLDEVCHHTSRKQFALDTLKFFLSLTTSSTCDVKLWCSSQPRNEIKQLLGGCRYGKCLALTEAENKRDISRFIVSKMGDFFDGKLKHRKIKSLLAMAETINGNFLLAAVLTEAIREAATGRKLDELIKSMPDSFEEYLKKKIRCINPEHYETFSKIMSCLIYAKRRLSFGELCEAVEDDLDPVQIQEQCAPFVRIESKTSDITPQSICSIYHNSVRRFIEDNPHILRSEACQDYNAVCDISLSRHILASATLRYLQQPRYKHLLRVDDADGSISLIAKDGSNIDSHHLLIYSAKYWVRHVDELQISDQAHENQIYQQVDNFVKSKNFGTCLQVQSLFVQEFFTSRGDGKSLEDQYQDAIIEWGYFLRSVSALHGQYPSQIDKCLWSSLGCNNFMHLIKSQLKGYALEDSDYRQRNSLAHLDNLPSFIKCGPCGCEISVVYLQERIQLKGSTLQVELQKWSMKKPGHRYKLKKSLPPLVCDQQMRLYTSPLKDHQIGRPRRVDLTADSYTLRIGSMIYIRDQEGTFRHVDLKDVTIEYIEDMSSSDSRIAIVHRSGMMPTDNPNASHGQSCLTLGDDQHRGNPSTTSSQSCNDSSSDSDSTSDEEATYGRNHEMSISGYHDASSEGDGMDIGTWSSNSARESESEGSTAQASDELVDDDIWNDWGDIDEDMDTGSQISAEGLTDAASEVPEELKESGDEMSIENGSIRDYLSDGETSDISLKSTIPLELWGDSSSVSSRSDGDSELPIWEEPSQGRLCDRRELVIFNLDRSTGEVKHLFRYTSHWRGRQFDSPPIIHPSHHLAVWPVGRNEILFADFTDPDDKTYFISTLGCGSKTMCHVSMQAHFSSCGRYLHIACLDGDTGGGSAVDQERESIKAMRSLHLRVFTYRMSHRKLTRSRPRLIYRAEIRLDCHRLGSGSDDANALSASPLPYALTWTDDHVYATESFHRLRVYRMPLFGPVEESELDHNAQSESDPGASSGQGSDSDEEMNRRPTQVAFQNTSFIYLPNSSNRRAVRFFPVVNNEHETTKTSSTRPTAKEQGKRAIGTVVIEPEDSVTSKVQQPYVGPAQVLHLTVDQFGPWKRVEADATDRGLHRWKGDYLQARFERFDTSNDCDIVPYFR